MSQNDTPPGSTGVVSRYEITRKFHFEAGHRIARHESKCWHLHGHSYRVFVTVAPRRGLDVLGRVIDFGVLKERIGGWLDAQWDHVMILDVYDTQAREALRRIPGQRVYLLPYPPTAENLARYLVETILPVCLHNTDVQVVRVTVHETQNCYAQAVAKEVGS